MSPHLWSVAKGCEDRKDLLLFVCTLPAEELCVVLDVVFKCLWVCHLQNRKSISPSDERVFTRAAFGATIGTSGAKNVSDTEHTRGSKQLSVILTNRQRWQPCITQTGQKMPIIFREWIFRGSLLWRQWWNLNQVCWGLSYPQFENILVWRSSLNVRCICLGERINAPSAPLLIASQVCTWTGLVINQYFAAGREREKKIAPLVLWLVKSLNVFCLSWHKANSDNIWLSAAITLPPISPFRFPLFRVFQLVFPHLCGTGERAGPWGTDDGKCCSVQSQVLNKGSISVMMSFHCSFCFFW